MQACKGGFAAGREFLNHVSVDLQGLAAFEQLKEDHAALEAAHGDLLATSRRKDAEAAAQVGRSSTNFTARAPRVLPAPPTNPLQQFRQWR